MKKKVFREKYYGETKVNVKETKPKRRGKNNDKSNK